MKVNLTDENFGVNELAAKTGLSRSQIHRRLKSGTNKSFSQFIREIRLEKAKELLKDESLTISEIAYKVGFGSPSYFIKSFHDYFGYPPGDYRKYAPEETVRAVNKAPDKPKTIKTGKSLKFIISIIILISAVVIIYIIVQNRSIKEAQIPVEKSIIVLPFENLSSDERTQSFADGITNEIRSHLAKISGLKVITGMSAEQFRETKLSSPEIARQVNASYILTGSVQSQDNDVHISVVLSDALQDRILWPEKYDRKWTDIFSIYIDIAENVTGQLQTILSPEVIKQIDKLRPKNPEAYNNYLMGQYLCLKRDTASVRKGIEYFEKAIEIDPEYTLAYAGLADAHFLLSFHGVIERSTGYKTAYEKVEKALGKDSTLAETYAVLGAINTFGYWNWEEARKNFENALAIDSNCVMAHIYYASLLDIVGEPDRALKHLNSAIELEPYHSTPYMLKGTVYRNKKEYSESIKAFRRSLDLI